MAYGDLDSLQLDGTHQKEEVPLGFFGCEVTVRAGGSYGFCLLADELFVRPEYQHLHIGLDLVAAMFLEAKLTSVEQFEGVSYADENGQPMNWWKKIGACDENTVPNSDGLILISGDIDTLLHNIQNIKDQKKEGRQSQM